MIRYPDGLSGKVLGVAAGCVAVVVIYATVVSPLQGFYDRGQQELQVRLDALRRLERSAAELPRLRKAAEQWRGKMHDGALLLAGSSDTVAGATLQSTMKDLIEQNGAKLSSAEILPPAPADKFQRVGIRVSFAGGLTLLTTVLRGIETSHPVMFVDNLEVRSGDAPAAPKDEGDSTDDAGATFTIALDVYGFRAL